MELDKQAIVNLLNGTYQNQPFVPQDWQGVFAKHSKNKIVAVISTPKSGSTYIANVISNHGRIPSRRLCYAYASNEHDLYLPALVTAKLSGGVSQIHMRATPHNMQLMNAFDVKGIVVTRNIFDAVASFKRDIQKKLCMEPLGVGLHGYSFVWLTGSLKKLSDSELMEHCIDFYVPWYINFVLSWNVESKNKRLLFVRYEQLMKNREEVFSRIMEHIGINPAVPQSLLNSDFLRGSKSISGTQSEPGSGYSALTKSQIKNIERRFAMFEGQHLNEFLDFSC